MKIAKASADDIQYGLDLVRILEGIANGYFVDDATPTDEPEAFDPENSFHLQRFYQTMINCYNARPGGLARIVWGYATLNGNAIFDPELSYLEINPALWENLDAKKPTDLNWLFNKIAGDLPEGYELMMTLENGCGVVALKTPDHCVIDGYLDDTNLDQQIVNLLSFACSVTDNKAV